MGYEDCYSNSYQSKILGKARTNTLQLEEWFLRRKNSSGDGKCKLCGHEKEDLEHFVIKCRKLEKCRKNEIMSRIPRRLSAKRKTLHLLFKIRDWKEIAGMLLDMWNERRRMIN